jgi:hypothetical protein
MAIGEYGTIINIVEKDVLDSFSASWSRPSSREPDMEALNYYKAYAMDPNDPLAFWLWPRPVEGADVIVTYAGIPPEVESTSSELTLSDSYLADLVDYVVYRALSKEARGGAAELAERYRASFLARLGANRQIMRQIGQNTTRPPDAEA